VDGYIADAAITVDLSGHPSWWRRRSGFRCSHRAGNSRGKHSRYRCGNRAGHNWLWLQTGCQPHRPWPREILGPRRAIIPNKVLDRGTTLKEGDVIAIEPFATNGSGRISEASQTEIFGFSGHRPVRSPQARELSKEIQEKYKTLPFARRWLVGERIDYALSQLLRAGIIHSYSGIVGGRGRSGFSGGAHGYRPGEWR